MKVRYCLECGKEIQIVNRADNNRKHCSQACAKRGYQKRTKRWVEEHPGIMTKYNKARLVKNPGAWRDKHRQERIDAIRLLGSVCIVCGVSNSNWLHIDYVPTTNGKPYRHPRHLKYIKEHLEEFRLLCANHHLELTLTGQIQGTEITQ